MAQSDIEKRASFDLIRYAQAWEDADILVAALRPKPGDTVVSIASAAFPGILVYLILWLLMNLSLLQGCQDFHRLNVLLFFMH